MNAPRTIWHWLNDTRADTNDDPMAPVTPERQQNGPLLVLLAFCWGVLATGLLVGGTLSTKMPFDDFLMVTLIGNTITLLIGWGAGEIGFRTGLNTGLILRRVYGARGAILPILFLAAITTGYHAVVSGAFGFAWAQSDHGTTFLIATLCGGLLITLTTIFGISMLEKLAIPKAVLLTGASIYACTLDIRRVGGWDAIVRRASELAPAHPDYLGGINFVVGSWVVGAIVMAEYTRFARSRKVSMLIPISVLMVAQWFMQIVGAIGVLSGGEYEFTAVLMAQGQFIGVIGLMTISLALWVSGSANLYFPGVQVSAATGLPRRMLTLFIGLIGIAGAFGLYQHFEGFLNFLGNVAPPVIGPVLCQYYVSRTFDRDGEENAPRVNLRSYLAFFIGMASTLVTPPYILPALFGLAVSMAASFVLEMAARRRVAQSLSA